MGSLLSLRELDGWEAGVANKATTQSSGERVIVAGTGRTMGSQKEGIWY